jgi:hypothetical protein
MAEHMSAHSDHGSVLRRDQAAITWSPQDGFCFLMPEYPEEAHVPPPVLAMVMLFTKLGDDEFVQSLLDEITLDD